jgi:hypothetical protein
MDAPLRAGWVRANINAYTYCLSTSDDIPPTYGIVSKMYSGDGWRGVVLDSVDEDLAAHNIHTLEEAIIWVEMTSALTRE